MKKSAAFFLAKKAIIKFVAKKLKKCRVFSKHLKKCRKAAKN